MKNYLILLALIIGIAAGVAGAIYGPQYVKPYLPKAMKAADTGVEGEVISKLKEQSRLLVTVKTLEGSILITFTKKVPEIDLLVREGDIVNLGIIRYKPFINDPTINRVRKPDQKPQMKPEPMPEPETMKEEEPPAKAEPEAAEAAKPEQKTEQKKMEPTKEAAPEATEKTAAEEAAPVTNSAK